VIFISLFSCDYLSVYVYVGFAEMYLRFSRGCSGVPRTQVNASVRFLCKIQDISVRIRLFCKISVPKHALSDRYQCQNTLVVQDVVTRTRLLCNMCTSVPEHACSQDISERKRFYC